MDFGDNEILGVFNFFFVVDFCVDVDDIMGILFLDFWYFNVKEFCWVVFWFMGMFRVVLGKDCKGILFCSMLFGV